MSSLLPPWTGWRSLNSNSPKPGRSRPQMKREWFVPEELPQLLAEQVYVPVSREEAQDAHVEAEIISRRIGGVVKVGPIRFEVGDNWVTVGYQFRWESFAPGDRAPAQN